MPYRWIVDPLAQVNEPFPDINVETDLMYYSNAPPIAWSLISRWNYTDLKRPQRPPLTLYTIFPLEVYLVIFWLLIFLQPVFVYFAKKYSNPGPFGTLEDKVGWIGVFMPWKNPKFHLPWKTLKNFLEVSLIILNVARRSSRKLV